MLARPIVCVLLIISATQAFPSTDAPVGQKQMPTTSDVVVAGEKLYCIKKIQWYRNVTKELEKMLDKFSEMLATNEINADDRIRIKAEYDQIENMKSDFMKKFDPDLEKLRHTLDDQIRLDWCKIEMFVYRLTGQNLTLAGDKLKSDVLNILDHAGVSKPVRDGFDKSLSEVVNWLFITNVNVLKNVDKLRKSCSRITENGRKLEKEWTLKPDGKVETPEVVEPEYHDEDVIVDKELDKKVQEDTKEILDHTAVDEAKARAAERMKNQSNDNDDGGVTLLGLSPGVVVAVCLVSFFGAILAGVVTTVLKARSRRYSQFS